jgi:uncharacterized protein YfaP (DUF2135 family)
MTNVKYRELYYRDILFSAVGLLMLSAHVPNLYADDTESIATSNASSPAAKNLPIGGWRYLDSQTASFTQDVHYPANRVNGGGKSKAALIAGQIAATPKAQSKQRKTPKLIVNGVSMPLSVDETGHYERPYMFGAGSNNVAINNADGSKAVRTQFYEANAGRTPSKMRIVLSWSTDNTDVDLHVITPKGEHAWYGNRILKDGSGIDVDVTTGYGPEIYSSPSPGRGEYQVYVNYYGGRDDKQIITTARVNIITDEGTAREKQQTFDMPLHNVGELIKAKSFLY